jgi:hypothetical protein
MIAQVYIVEVMPPHRADQECLLLYRAFDSLKAAEAFAERQMYDKVGDKTGYACLIVEADPPDDGKDEDIEVTFARGRTVRRRL